jgi:hypothetical protein
VVTYTRKVLDTTTTDQHDAVLLEVVAFARDVSVDLFRVGETYTGHLTHSGVRLFRRGGVHTYADTSLLRARIQRAGLALYDEGLASFAD